jgi:hypothetical protein
MAIDASIYQNIRPVEIPSVLDSQQKAMSLSQLAMQNQGIAKKMQQDDRSQNILAQKQKIAEIGNAIEPLAGMTPEERAAAYPQTIQVLVKNGTISPTDAPPQYDESFFRQTYDMYHRSNEYLQNAEAQAKIAKLQSEAKSDPLDKDLARQKTKAEISKLYSESAKAAREKDEKVPTQAQYLAGLFGTRAAQAENVFNDLGKSGFDPTSAKNVAQTKLPGFLEGFKSDDIKKQDQAQRNFVNAILRRESGAAIAESEFDSARKQYFPQFGDSPEVLKQKEQNRKTAIAALSAEGGPAMSKIAQRMNSMGNETSVPSNNAASFSDPLVGKANATPLSKLSPQDAEAIFWANKNKSDPRAQQILQMHGVK